MRGRVCLVTGATSGIGLAAARNLAATGATVLVVGRTPDKASAAAAVVAATTGAGPVEWLAAEFADQQQVRALAAEVERRHDRLDVLVDNAGAILPRRQLTADGIELTFAVNHLAPFLLTTRLIPLLTRTAPARVIVVASTAHERGQLELDDLEFRRGYLPFRAYARSKLANVLFTYELARRLAGTGVTANAYDPGLVRTKLGRGNGALRDLAWGITHAVHRDASSTPEAAAAGLVRLATATDLETVTGMYFRGGEAVPSSPRSHDRRLAAELWNRSEELTGQLAAPV